MSKDLPVTVKLRRDAAGIMHELSLSHPESLSFMHELGGKVFAARAQHLAYVQIGYTRQQWRTILEKLGGFYRFDRIAKSIRLQIEEGS